MPVLDEPLKVVTIRVTTQELESLHERAARNGLSLNAMIRSLLVLPPTVTGKQQSGPASREVRMRNAAAGKRKAGKWNKP